MRFTYLVAAVVLCLGVGTANAARVNTVFDFTVPSDSAATSGASLEYTVGSDTLTARGYRFDSGFFYTNPSFSNATVTQSGFGLGIGGGLSGSFVDGAGSIFGAYSEFLVLEMPSLAWQPEQLVLSLPLGGLLGDYTVFGSNGDLSDLAGFTSAVGTSNYDVLYASTLSGVVNPLNFSDAGEYANIVIAASVLDPDGLPLVSLNKFGVAGFTGSTNVVPLPAALPLLATGLALFGLVRTRRRAA